MSDEKKGTYTESKKRCYERNKVKIAEKEKDKKRWLEYYAENKEAISARRKERRLKKELPAIDEDKVRRYNEIMEEAKTLKKEIRLKKIREKALARREAKKAPADSPGLGLNIVSSTGIENNGIQQTL